MTPQLTFFVAAMPEIARVHGPSSSRVLRATTKKGRQLFSGKKCTPEKILATPIHGRQKRQQWTRLVRTGLYGRVLAQSSVRFPLSATYDAIILFILIWCGRWANQLCESYSTV